jgi:hypothetical protein
LDIEDRVGRVTLPENRPLGGYSTMVLPSPTMDKNAAGSNAGSFFGFIFSFAKRIV